MSLLATERATYEAAWALPAYAQHSPGEVYVPLFLEMVSNMVLPQGSPPFPDAAWTPDDYSVLDAGCGAGKGGQALAAAGFHVGYCDLVAVTACRPFVQACLWDTLTAVPYLLRAAGLSRVRENQVDFVYCCDVLEHIPTPFTMLVVSRLLEVARRGVFLSIALVPDQFGTWVGKPLHQTVQSFTAWRDQLDAVGTVVESRDLITTGVYLVTSR